MKLKIGTFNARLGFLIKPTNEAIRQAKVASLFTQKNYDVVGFSEVWSDTAKGIVCKNFPYKYFYETHELKMGSGLALASKYPIFDTEMIDFNDLVGEDALSEKGYIRAIIHTPSGDFRLYMTHTQADAISDLSDNKIISRLYREKNLEQIANIKTYQPHLPVIVMGDLNVNGESDEYASKPGVFSSMTDAYRRLHPNKDESPGYTYDANNPMVQHWDGGYKGGERLDYILYSGNSDWSVDNCSVDSNIKESDHYPLVATVELLRSAQFDFPKTQGEALNQLEKKKATYGFGSSTKIVITNHTRENLLFVHAHSWYGNFLTQLPPYIPAGRSVAILHVHPEGKSYGSEGCIILRQGSSDFFLGFDTPWGAAKNKILVQTRGNNHWWKEGSKSHMKDKIEDSNYASTDSNINNDNIKFTLSGKTEKGTSPTAKFTIKGDDRPIPTIKVIGGNFTYDGQKHPATVVEKPSVPGTVKVIYEPGGAVVPINAGIYKVKVFFVSKDKKYQNATRQTTITIKRAKPKITWAKPVDIIQSTGLGEAQLNATVTTNTGKVKGKLSYFWYNQNLTNGIKLPAGLHTLSVRFEPYDSRNFEGALENVQLRVWVAEEVLKEGKDSTFSHLAQKYYGHATPHYWQWIIDANKGKIPTDYKRTRLGTKIFIPEKPPQPKSKLLKNDLSLFWGGIHAEVSASSLEVREVPDENGKNLRYLKKGDKIMVVGVWENEAGDRWGKLAENEWSAMLFEGKSFMNILED